MAQDPRPAPEHRQSLVPVVVAFLLAGAAVLALGIWASGREAARPEAVPALELVEPDSGAALDGPVDLLFRTAAPLRLEPSGWQAGRLHLHAIVNGTELMPAAADVHALGDGRFRWTLPPLRPGRYAIQLFWAGPHHGQLEEGASRRIEVLVR